MKVLIPLFKPAMGKEELKEVKKVLFSGWTGLGPKTQEFEEKFASFIGVKYAIGVSSGTAALHLALRALDLKPSEEVISTALTFVSTNHAILYNRATPVFADIYPDTLTLDVSDIRRKITSKTRVILPVHYGGHAVELDEIMELCRDKGIHLVEDAAHACGAKYRNRYIGSFGDMTCFSFHAVKNLSMGEGGMITTNNAKLYERIKKLRWMGIDKTTWERSGSKKAYSWQYTVDELGFKEHLDDIHSAIGLAQLAKLEKLNKRRRRIVSLYNEGLSKINWIKIPIEKPYVKSSYHLYVIQVPAILRDRLIDYLAENGISTSVHYYPNHLFPVYQPYRVNLPITEEIAKRIVSLPLYPALRDIQVEMVIDTIYSFSKKIKANKKGL